MSVRGVAVALATIVVFACGRPSTDDAIDGGDPGADASAVDSGAESGLEGDAAADGAGMQDAAVGPPIRVLFVGNSYTFYGDLPGVVAVLAATTPAPRLEVQSVTMGGATLCDHVGGTGAAEAIRTGGFDVVVLQGQSLEPLLDPETFVYCGQSLWWTARDAGSHAVWFATWARRAGDPIYAELGITPAEMAAGLEANYAYLARNAGGFVARVGAAWQLALSERPDVTLHMDDGSHPTPEGTLLAACTIAQAITGHRPSMPSPVPLGVASETAEALCDLGTRAPCADDLTFCDRRCVDVSSSDPEHCGACEATCFAPHYCWTGACECTAAHVTTAPFESLGALEPECTARSDHTSAACAAAAHDLCAMQECATSGFGPFLTPDGAASLTCVDGDVASATYAELAALAPGCDAVTDTRSAACAAAIHRYCVARGSVSGFGPTSRREDGAVDMTCVSRATILRMPYQVLAAFDPTCDGIAEQRGSACTNAIRRMCQTMGHVDGYGPVEIFSSTTDPSGFEADVVCLLAR